MQIPAFDPRSQDEPLLEEIKAAIAEVLDSGRYIGGPALDGFERELAAYVGASEAIGVSSGTDALLAVLMALDVGPGRTVITTPFTFFATAGSVVRLGGTVRFCDVGDDLALDVQEVRRALLDTREAGEKVAAILPVHLFGRASELGELRALAEEFGTTVIEDAAQAIGARCGDERVGSMARAACFSFYPTKNLGAFGDAGAITTDDAELALRLRSLRNHGMEEAYVHPRVGGNFRLDGIQAAALAVKLRHVDGWIEERRRLAARYTAGLAERGLDELRAPETGGPGEHVFHQYVVRVPRRDELKAALAERGIGSAVYYPVPLHQQPCLQEYAPPAGCPRAEAAAREVLALPMWPGLGDEGVDAVLAGIEAFYRA